MPPTKSVIKTALHFPSLEEVARVLQDGLKKNFSNIQVNVVDCPDLTQKPFYLASAGLGGSPRLADVGGVPYLVPTPKKDKLYNLSEVAKLVELPGAFIVGAGAGPFGVVGVNSELICNIQFAAGEGRPARNNTHFAKIDPKNGGCILDRLHSEDFNLMGNFLCTEGKSGKVIEIRASKRIGEDDFMAATRKSLKDHYQNKPVGLGGVFLIENGKAHLHIMPDFSCTPLTSEKEVDSWLKFFEMDAPLICLGELVSHDPDLDLRIEHFHCFSDHGQGGHYHYDITPDDVSYLAYFNVAEFVYRIDRPPKASS